MKINKKKKRKLIKKTILIVGGSGFLGYHLSKFFLKKKWHVISLSLNPPSKFRKLVKVKYFNGDVSKLNQIKFLSKIKVDYVINCGGYVDHSNKKKTFNTHVNGCKNLVKIFMNKKIKTFVQIGSSTEYGSVKSPQVENKRVKPTGSYGKNKLMANRFLKNLKTFFPYIIIRPYQIYGSHQDNNRLIPFIINSCLEDKKFPCTTGVQYRDFLYIDDFVSSIDKCLDNKRCYKQIINIGFGKPIRVKKIINNIKKMIKSGDPQFGKILMRNYEQKKVYPCIKKAFKYINWRPKVNLDKGLNKTIKFYKSLKK